MKRVSEATILGGCLVSRVKRCAKSETNIWSVIVLVYHKMSSTETLSMPLSRPNCNVAISTAFGSTLISFLLLRPNDYMLPSHWS